MEDLQKNALREEKKKADPGYKEQGWLVLNISF